MKNSAFACCSHCGDQFFKTDLIKTPHGRLCPCCKEKGGF
nr:MAG TPA: LysW biosynthesis protein LysW [Caudoviricetes sp.]